MNAADALLGLIMTQLLYLTYKIGKIEARLRQLEKLINNHVAKNTG